MRAIAGGVSSMECSVMGEVMGGTVMGGQYFKVFHMRHQL